VGYSEKLGSWLSLGIMVKQVERQVRDLQKEFSEVQKEWDLVCLQPCRGDGEIRQKDERLSGLEKRLVAIREQIRELERKRREGLSETVKKAGYESPFT